MRFSLSAQAIAMLLVLTACDDAAGDKSLAVTVGAQAASVEVDIGGAVLELKTRARVTLPEGSVTEPTTIRIEVGDLEELPTRPGDGYEAIGAPLIVTPHGLRLERNATVEIGIEDEDTPKRDLRVLRLDNERDRTWEELDELQLIAAGDDAHNAGDHRLARPAKDGEDTVTRQRRLEFDVDGFSVFLPVRVVAASESCTRRKAGYVCRPSQGACDAEESCDGSSDACPPDAVEGKGEPCRKSAGTCDVAEVCDGESPVCPVDGVRAAESICRPVRGACDAAEACDGSSSDCPADIALPPAECSSAGDAGADATTDAGDTDAGPGGTANCPDTSSYTWSALTLVEPTGSSDGNNNAIGIDDMGRAFALIEGSSGASIDMRFNTYDPSTGWGTTSTPITASPSGGGTWSPSVVANGAGDVLAIFRRNTGGLSAIHYDTSGNSLSGGLGFGPEANNFWGGFALGANGEALISVSQYDVDRRKGFVSIDYQPATILFDDVNGGAASRVSIADDNTGVVMGSSTDGTGAATYQAVPYSVAGGLGSPEPVHPPTHQASNGSGGVALGGGEVFAAFGSSMGSSGTRVQLFAVHRDAGGTWSSPRRFDTGDDSAHARLWDVQQGRTGEAFVLWDQPDGRYIGRAAGSDVITDIGTVANNNNASNAMRTDRCGNAIYAYSDSGDTNVYVRRYVAGSGWQAAAPIDPAYDGIGQDVAVAMSPQGRAAVIFYSGSLRYYAATFGP